MAQDRKKTISNKDDHYLKRELYDLIKSDSRIFDFIQEGSLDGMWYWNLEAIEDEWMNAKFWETLGYDPEQKAHLSSEWQHIIFEEDLNMVNENFNKHLHDPNHPFDQIVRYRHKNGSTVWIRCRGMAIRDETGKPIRMLGAHTDITKLKESEIRFDILHNASFGGIGIHDKGLILDCNQGLSDITGYSIEELIGMNGLLLIAPDYRDLVMKNILAGYEHPYEAFGVRKNGQRYPLKIEGRNIPYQGKKVRVVEFRDLSDIKREEASKLASEKQFRLLTSEMQLGLALHEIITDKSGKPVNYRFLGANKSFENLTGLKLENIIGKTVLEVLPNTEPIWIERYGQVALTGQSLQFENYAQELGKYFSVTAYRPKHRQFAVIVDDITPRKLMELQMFNQKETLRATLNSIGDAVIATDSNGIITGINPVAATLTGYPEKEALGKPFQDVFHIICEDCGIELENPVKRALETNQTVEITNHTLLMSRNGKQYYIEDTASPIKDDTGATIGVVLVFRDVSEKKQKNDEILHVSKHDYLTALPNRRYFEEKLAEMDTQSNYPLLVCMIDLDGLKLINDAYGHHAGDIAIKIVGEQIKKHLRPLDFAARIGGDEFIILCPNTTEETFKDARNAILKALATRYLYGIQLSVSFGYDTKTKVTEDIDAMLINAENNMYARKVLHGRSNRNEMIMTLFSALKEKHDVERIHSDRVSQYCRLMGEKLKLSVDEIKELEIAGLMHDIGKITIPDHILDKPGKLSEDEWTIMKNHAINGYQILRSADKYSRLAEYALTHHERWDGKGYPNGLKGDEIPLFSRIIHVCDAYEAMTADRPYRKALSPDIAISELIKYSGTQFDPRLIEVFVKEVLSQ